MLDPFAGVGTISFEAALAGIQTYAFEISPAALHISAAKLGRSKPEECERIVAELGSFIGSATMDSLQLAEANLIKFNGSLSDYFHPRTFTEILAARSYFWVQAATIDIGVAGPGRSTAHFAWQSTLRIKPELSSDYTFCSHRPNRLPSTRSHAYAKNLNGHSTRGFPYRSCPVGEILLKQDATSCWAPSVCNLDAIITSPPFYDSTRFYLANWMRLWFCGWEKSGRLPTKAPCLRRRASEERLPGSTALRV